MVEIREHPQYEGYGASQDGRVWSRRNGGWNGASLESRWTRELKPHFNGRYKRFQTSDKTTHLVHRFVLECWVGPCPPGMECRHLDGDGANNKLSNLRWGTKVENMADKTLHGTLARTTGERSGNAKLTEADVLAIRADPRLHRVIAGEYGVSPATVSNIKQKATWRHLR